MSAYNNTPIRPSTVLKEKIKKLADLLPLIKKPTKPVNFFTESLLYKDINLCSVTIR